MGALIYAPYSVLIVLSFISFKCVQSQIDTINVLHVNEENNGVAETAVRVASLYADRRDNLKMFVKLEKATGYDGDSRKTLISLCTTYRAMVDKNEPPQLLLDTTRTGIVSETVKGFASALGIPTVSGTFGQVGDFRQWKRLTPAQQNYLIQIMPPADLIPELVKVIMLEQHISNAAILFDDSFMMDYKYTSLLQNIAARHVVAAVQKKDYIKNQLVTLREMDIMNFFILGSGDTAKSVLNAADDLGYFTRTYAWYVLTQETEELNCTCRNATIIHIKPSLADPYKNRLETLQRYFQLNAKPPILAAFYFDLALRSFMAVKHLLATQRWPKDMTYIKCEAYDGLKKNTPPRENLLLNKSLSEVTGEEAAFGPFLITSNGKSYMQFNMEISAVEVRDGSPNKSVKLGKWKASMEPHSKIEYAESQSLSKYRANVVYRVYTIIQPPFVYVNTSQPKGYHGFCIELMDEIAKYLDFDYEIKIQKEGGFGSIDEKENWNGIVKSLMEKKADIGLGSMAVMAERETVIDFTVPFYDLVGITILMKLHKSPPALFKFLTVLEHEVWICILSAYFLTSLLIWIFDRWSPYSYQNNREKYIDDEEKREFHLKESLWFSMTSLTPQGGGEAPKNLSGRLVAATWWLFGFIIIASYTANLAAFLTVSRLEVPVESLDDLSKQYRVKYSPLKNSEAALYFQRMANIEAKFYDIWKDMSLNDSLNHIQRAQFAVWDYPVSDRYTKMWETMKHAGLMNTLDEAVAKVRQSRTQNDGYAYIGDAIDIRYLELTTCDLQVVGDEFSRKPFALAVQQGSPLKDQLNRAILHMLNNRTIERLKDYWWEENPFRVKCEKREDQTEGISLQNIGGLFIVVLIGIGAALVTLVFEFVYHRCRKVGDVIDITAGSKDEYDIHGQNINKDVKMPEKDTSESDTQHFKTLSVYPTSRF